MNRIILIALISFFGLNGNAQENQAFTSLKIGNLQSTNTLEKGTFCTTISHRFGTIKGGVNTFFGLDYGNTKFQFLYGITDVFQISLSRESVRKTIGGALKWGLMSQTNGAQINLSAYSTINANTELSKEVYPKMLFYDRLSYTTQLIASRAFTNKFSFELAPTFVRQNLVHEPFQLHNQWACGLGGRYKIANHIELIMDYVMNFSRAPESIYNDPLTLGVNFETERHVFQVLLSNAQSTNEPGFISNAEGSWLDGEIYLGFNLVRTFKR